MPGDSQVWIAGWEERVFAVSQELTPVEVHELITRGTREPLPAQCCDALGTIHLSLLAGWAVHRIALPDSDGEYTISSQLGQCGKLVPLPRLRGNFLDGRQGRL